jgi:hypothetical protein
MNNYKFLGFFDKNGSDLNFVYNESEDLWEGQIFIPRISVNLYETVNIFIVEEFITTGNIKKYGIPHYRDLSLLNTSGPKWLVTWNDDISEELFLYQFKLGDFPILETLKNIEVDVNYDLNQQILIDGQLQTDVVNESSIQLNIGLKSEVEGIYERQLLIKDKELNKVIARIDFYGETIEEDERLPQNLYKLGFDISPEEYKVFRDSDINEALPDFDLLNHKMVELLVEGRNIKPFVGTYKGLINAIKFYGYDNIQIKEFWLNIDKESTYYGKYKTTPIKQVFDKNVDFNDNSFELPNKIYKKTNLFSLVYRLNNITGEFDKFDLPIVEETSEFTTEEVLIKLFGLKEILKKKWLSSNSKIIDIVGEGDYFSRIKQNVWISQNRIEKIDSGIHPCFNILPEKKGYIQDLRTVGDIIFPQFTPFLIDPNLAMGSNIIISDLADILLAYFTNYSPNLNTVEQLPDKPGIPVGYPIVLQNCSFDTTWNKAIVNWDELLSTGSLIIDFKPTNIGSGDIYIIKDRLSGEEVSFTVPSSTTTIEDVVTALYNEILIKLALGDGRPWSFYSISLEDTLNTGTNNTIRFRQIFSGNIGVDLIGEAINLGFPQSPGPEMLKQFVTGNSLNTWDTYGIGNFYELEWRVFKPADTTPAYDFSIRGGIGELNNLPLVLPYSGKYTVKLNLYDTFNQVSQSIKSDCIEVLNKNVEFVGFYKFREREYNWLTSTNWDFYTSYWDLPIIPQAFTWEGHASLYESLDRANYILNNSNPDMALSYHYFDPLNPFKNTLYTPGAYSWDNLGPGKWNEGYHLWWNSTKVSGDTPSNFRIYNVTVGETLTIEQDLPFTSIGIHTFNTSDLEQAAFELNNSSDPVISKYIYNPVYEIITGNNTDVVFIQAVARYFGKNGDWSNITWSQNNDIRYLNLHETNNPLWDEIKFVDDSEIIPKMVFITFTYDKSKIPGKHLPKWRIIYNDDSKQDDIYFTGRWLTYLFKFSGRYTIELTLEDTNGNISSVSKNMIIVK